MGVVQNHDVVGLYNRINRFLTEMIKSVSSGTSRFTPFDQTRLGSYLDAIDRYHDWVVAQPQLDLPETAPRAYQLEAPPEVPDTESEDVNDTIRLLVTARDELSNSQAARDPAGFNAFDSGRLRAVTAKARAFLVDYIAPTQPLDLPESSPQVPSTGAGHGGVNPP